MHPKPARFPWEEGFPPVLVHAQKSEVTTHPWFAAARSGDVDAAALLVADTCCGQVVDRLAQLAGSEAPMLAGVHAQKRDGLNVLPDVLAQGLQQLLGWQVDTDIVQANIVEHVDDPAFVHLARQAVFDGTVEPGRAYVLVDDFIRQGGTLANLRGHIMRQGGRVLGATVLTGNASSAVLRPGAALLRELRDKHGSLENWWEENFGYRFDCFTAVEAGFVAAHRDSDHVRARIEAAWRA
ncbi:phosphoribosyltransferase [Massilia agilis]|uniref:Phosphoribosyltransferase n=1 Tax=Massilia agilis TaxID=1811226 RepID=A0ABT2D8C1_9BURK|nr:phosphoribosyltransferase [Massilia agilis]MCS0807567.1 phosphoribosyltransferase [Massilia agilis]